MRRINSSFTIMDEERLLALLANAAVKIDRHHAAGQSQPEGWYKATDEGAFPLNSHALAPGSDLGRVKR